MNKLVLNFEDVIVHSEHSDEVTVFRIPRSYKYYTDKENKIDVLVISHPALQTEMIDNKSTDWNELKVLVEDKLNVMDVQLDGCIYATSYGKPSWRVIPSELTNSKNKQKISWRELNKSYINSAGVFPYNEQSDGWNKSVKSSLTEYENSPVKDVLVTLSKIDFPEDLSLFGEHLYKHCIDEYCLAESIEDDSGNELSSSLGTIFNLMDKNNMVPVDVPDNYKIV